MCLLCSSVFVFFFFNDTATTEIYTLSLHDAFRSMTWCGQIDFRFTGPTIDFCSTNDNSLRELSGAVAMHFLLENSGQFDNWKLMDDVVRMFVGVPDSLNFAQ